MLTFAPMQHADPHDILKQYWGYSGFRPLQEEIVRSVLAGHDTLALLPTGGGKSICFQVPALCMEGICLVVTPLIALMRDQVEHLRQRGIPAAAIYSGMSARAVDITFENACNGAYKLLYLSPERLRTEIALARIPRMKVNLLAVDEAHCISQWGYDFRPPYLQLAELRPLLPKVPVLALTATATTEVLEDIQQRLAFRQKNVFRKSFERKNLSYSVLYEQHKRDKIIHILRSVPGTGIVYARSRGETKDIAHFLQARGFSADFYHAGLPAEERNTKQEAWMTGKTRIIVCTNAFGMGIDKPEVRAVIHINPPDSLEAYFQEAGRAGRDGLRSYAVLLYSPTDGDTLRHSVQTAYPSLEKIRQVYRALGSYTQLAVGAGLGENFDFDFQHFCATYRLDQAECHQVLRILELEGWISISEAAYAPARVHITADRERLYDFQLRHRLGDTVIKALLRGYGGIQQDFVIISEPVLAQYAKLSLDTFRNTLQLAQQEQILLYEPHKDKPQLTFIRERIAAENLTIDLEKFNFRKTRAIQRTEQSIHYAETRRCRSQLLLAYFDEPNAPACGICDVCTGRNRSNIPAQTIDSYQRKIRDVLLAEPLSTAELLSAFATKRHDQVMQVMTFLSDEGYIEEDNTGKWRLKK